MKAPIHGTAVEMLTFCTQREPNTHTWTWKYRAPTIGAPHLKICILLSLLCTATPTLAANWIVDSNGLGDFATIQAAIDVAADGDRIEVTWGHYQGNGASVINTQGKGLTLDAPFGASVWGAGQQTCIVCDSQEMADTIISGFIFHAGDGGNDRGGGIHLDGSSPTFIDCDIRECEADLGGGLRASNSNASFTNCTFENNTATRGGGLHLTQFTGEITDCTIESNEADSAGAGIWCHDSTFAMMCTTITMNTTADGPGGGFFCEQACPTITGCEFSDNTAGVDGGSASCKGGGIYCGQDSCPSITDTSIATNTAWMGGGLQSDWSSAMLSTCVVIANNGVHGGGGLSISGGDLSMVDSAVVSNESSAGSGGGISIHQQSTAIIARTMIQLNSTPVFGGGLLLDDADATIENCDIRNNSAFRGGGVRLFNEDRSVLEGCALTGNMATHGGGVSCDSNPTSMLAACQFSDNTASADYSAFDAGQDVPGPTLSDNRFCANGLDSVGGTLVALGGNARADLNGSDGVDVVDLILLVTNWGDPMSTNTIDVDLDGAITIQDLLVMLQSWGQCTVASTDIEYLTATARDGMEQADPIHFEIDSDAWSAQHNFDEFSAILQADQNGGSMQAPHGTSDGSWPQLRVTVTLTEASTTLQLEGYVEIPATSAVRFTVKRLRDCGDVTHLNASLGNANDGPDEYSGTLENLPPGTYEFRLSGMLYANGVPGHSIGISWTYD